MRSFFPTANEIDKLSTASLITRVTTDVANVQNAYQMCLRQIIRAPIMIVITIVMTYMLEPTLSLTFVVAAVLLGGVVALCMIKVAPHFRMMFKKYDDLNLVVQEDFTAIRVVKSYVRENSEIKKMHKATEDVYCMMRQGAW